MIKSSFIKIGYYILQARHVGGTSLIQATQQAEVGKPWFKASLGKAGDPI
jgi:hypothetical protein